jgi:hypothetical protein
MTRPSSGRNRTQRLPEREVLAAWCDWHDAPCCGSEDVRYPAAVERGPPGSSVPDRAFAVPVLRQRGATSR